MGGWRDLANIWTTFREVDIRPIREGAERAVVLAFIGADGAGKSTLIRALRHNARSHETMTSPTIEEDLTAEYSVQAADLAILVLDATRTDFSIEAAWYNAHKDSAKQVLVFFNKMDAMPDGRGLDAGAAPWDGSGVSFGSAIDPESLKTDFVPHVMSLLPERQISLARHFPLFRLPVARELINDTSAANATYSLGTGLAEVVPALDIPFNVADVVVLTKNQALMVYKLGLALGLPPYWQNHVSELGGVVGAGFLWRQVARQLVGLVPVWGIIPKVAVSYAGTYAVGEAVLYWYQTGRKIPAQRLHELYKASLAQGRGIAQALLARRPRPTLPRLPKPFLRLSRSRNICPNCARENPRDARFCAYCSSPLSG